MRLYRDRFHALEIRNVLDMFGSFLVSNETPWSRKCHSTGFTLPSRFDPRSRSLNILNILDVLRSLHVFNETRTFSEGRSARCTLQTSFHPRFRTSSILDMFAGLLVLN